MAINSLTPSSKGISGLASGMDTQTMVQQMLKGTQSKIDAKNSQKSVLTYKQEMYRNVAAQIKAFQNQFFSFTKPETNLMSSQLFQTMNATTQSKFFTAKATSGATNGKITIDKITSLATNHREASATKATGELSGNFSAAALKKIADKITDPVESNITIKIGEGAAAVDVKIALKDIAGKSTNDAIKVFNDAFRAANVDTKADFVENRIVFEDINNSAISIEQGKNVTGVLNSITTTAGQAYFTLDTKAMLPKISVNVDGLTKAITINPLDIQGSETGKDSVLRQLNAGVKAAFGAGITFENAAGTDKITLKTTNASSKVVLSGDDSVMSVIGIKSNLSNKINTTKSIKDVNFSTPLAGNLQKFSINGVDFSFSGGNSISNIIGTVNASEAGVRLSYDSVRDRFMIESTNSGVQENTANGTPFVFEQTEGNLLSVMFGANASDTYSTGNLIVENMKKTSTFDASTFDFKGGSFSIKFKENGVEQSYVFDSLTASTNPADVVKELNDKIAGTEGLKDANGNAKVSFVLGTDASGKDTITLQSADATKYDASVTGEGLSAFGYTAKVTNSTLMSELGFDDFTATFGGNTVSFTASQTLGDFMAQLERESGGTVSMETIGSTPFIRLAGVSIPMTFSLPAASKLFGAEITPGDGQMPSGKFSTNASDGKVVGTNAEAMVNGETITRSSNSFTIDGVSITLTGVTNEVQSIDVSQNTDVIFDAVKKFTEEYNKLVNNINGLLDADTTYRKYPPLTADQKKEMSDKEIELWEEKAKSGLLRGDSTLQGIQNSLRATVYTKPDAGGFALYDLGIKTDYFGTKDNLVIDDETKFKQKISENPDAIRRLFTDAESGLSTMMNNVMEKAASGGTRSGSLIQIAGTGNKDTTSTMYRQMKDIDDNISRLESKYKMEYNRYWKQFNNMEQQLAKMQQQSGWLSQQLGG